MTELLKTPEPMEISPARMRHQKELDLVAAEFSERFTRAYADKKEAERVLEKVRISP